ncbi:MAG: EAL domain-containing protein [Peptococcia bacterium]
MDSIMQKLRKKSHIPTPETKELQRALLLKQDEIKELQKEITRLTSYDDLTGLPNKKYLKALLDTQLLKAQTWRTTFAVIVMDIDGFQFINDALGYRVGDLLVKEIAQRLRDYLDKKIILSRNSSDRFALIVPGLRTREKYVEFAKDILKVISRPFRVEAHDINITMSMGMSIYQGEEHDSDSLMQKADVALYWAKHEGKNRLKVYAADKSIQDYKQFQLRNDLRNAIINKQFQVYYQPIVALKNSRVIAAEALLRWNHPEWGTVKPDEFIKLAEESGFIIEIESWVLEEVCRNYKEWLKAGMPAIKISVNISALQFFDNNFVERIRTTLEKYNLEPDFLIIEITESALIEMAEKVSSDIRSLQKLGIQVALDDFGTGFSSLGYLKNFDIDIIKIDRTFISNIVRDDSSAVITKAIIYIANGLNINLVAEGIDKVEQYNYLKELNCYAGQGYLYGKPAPKTDFEKILSQGKSLPNQATHGEKSLINRRKYFRLHFALLLEGTLTILMINGRNVNVGKTNILIRNIGPGGLCFISDLQLPVQREFIIQISTRLQRKKLVLKGHIVWEEESEEKLHKYGVEFIMEENERAELTKLLNTIQVKMKRNIMFTNGSFTLYGPQKYFQMQTGS